jgi:hypothetical protein
MAPPVDGQIFPEMSGRLQVNLLTALFILALGCGGKAQAGSGDGGGSGSSGSSGGGSGSSSGSGGIVAAEIPDAFPVRCAQYTFVLDPDAAANTCAFTPADVACSTNADCTTYVDVQCSCISPIYGVSTSSTARCTPPPCPQSDCSSGASGFYTQDCQLVPNQQDVAVACVDHQCMTYAVGS